MENIVFGKEEILKSGKGEEERVLLKAENIYKYFPGVVALNDVTYDLMKGEIHGLLGQNGAGKSTLLKILYGLYKPDRGRILFRGKEIKLKSPMDARRLGIVLVHQEITLIPDLSVLENIALLGYMWRNWASRFDRGEISNRVEKTLGNLGFDINLRARARDLSVAEKMLIQIAAALTVDAKVLLLDEPTSPMTPKEIDRLVESMKRLASRGVGIAFVTHRVTEAVEICDRITILRNGSKVATLRSSEADVRELIRLMLGRDIGEIYMVRERETKTSTKTSILVEIKDLHTIPRTALEIPLKGINIKIHKGEIVAVVGLIGSGKKELGRSLIGLSNIVSGDILFNGNRVKIKSPADALKLGILFVPEDRRYEGLIPDFTVAQNMDISSLWRFTMLSFIIDYKRERLTAADMIKRLNIASPGPETKVTKLSGGNQQKTLIARAMLAEAKLVILDEPTIGIDIGSKAEIRRIAYKYSRERGVSLLILTSDVDEALGIADRIYVIKDGVIIAEHINSEELSREELIAEMVGLKKVGRGFRGDRVD